MGRSKGPSLPTSPVRAPARSRPRTDHQPVGPHHEPVSVRCFHDRGPALTSRPATAACTTTRIPSLEAPRCSAVLCGRSLSSQRWVVARAFVHLHGTRRLRVRWEIRPRRRGLCLIRRAKPEDGIAIRPENLHRSPTDWPATSRRIQFGEAADAASAPASAAWGASADAALHPTVNPTRALKPPFGPPPPPQPHVLRRARRGSQLLSTQAFWRTWARLSEQCDGL